MVRLLISGRGNKEVGFEIKKETIVKKKLLRKFNKGIENVKS